MNPKLKQSIAKALLEIGAVGFSPDNPITFTSGIISPVYVDNRVLVYHPVQWRLVIDGFATYIRSRNLKNDVIAGVAVGGVPHSSALAYTLKTPSVFIRAETKAHGKRKLIEGGDVNGQRVLLVEDHVTTGGSSLEAVRELRKAGACVSDVLAVTSYRFPDTEKAFAQEKLALHTLTEFDILLEMARDVGQLETAHLPVVRSWLADPYGWSVKFA